MIPDYLTEAYKKIPKDVPVSVLMRHSIRFPIESDAEIWTAGLTPEGITLAMNLGNWLKNEYKVRTIETSPIVRCVDTGKWLINSFHNGHVVKPVDVLAHPNEKGEYDLIDHYMETGNWPLRILKMAKYIIPEENQDQRLNLYISHDTVIITMVTFWLGKEIRGPGDWPKFLEPFFIWWQDEKLIANFRGESTDVTGVYQKQLGFFASEKNS